MDALFVLDTQIHQNVSGDVLISSKLSGTPPKELLGDPKYEELSVSLFLQEENEWISCEVTF